MIRSINTLALNNLTQYPLRTLLSGGAVALGVAMIVATDVLSSALGSALTGSGGDQRFMGFFLNMTDTMFGLVGVVILLVAGFLVFNAFAMSITQRRQQIGALRALGMTRRQIMRLILVEALLTGVAGTIAGLLIGPLLGRGIIALIATFGAQMFVFGDSSLSPANLFLSAVLGIGVTVLSVLLPARAAASIPPLAALRAQPAGGVDRGSGRRTLIGWFIVGILIVYLIIATPGNWIKAPWNMMMLALFALIWLGCLGVILSGAIYSVGDWVRAPLTRYWGATGRLIADNLQRGRRRVMLTILTLAVGLTMIVGLTGMMTFFFKEIVIRTMNNAESAQMYLLAPFDIGAGVAGMAGRGMQDLQIPPEIADALRLEFSDSADIAELYLAFPPELAILPGLFSYVMDPQALQQTGEAIFEFIEGDWQTAVPIMEAGCGVLVAPAIAGDLQVGDTLTVTGASGPVDCRIAGIGSAPAGISIIGDVAAADFDVSDVPIYLMLIPHLGTDSDQLAAELDTFTAAREGVWAVSVAFVVDFQNTGTDVLVAAMNGMLLLAILAAALGVINTTAISVSERRQELGLLRAVGCTRTQVRTIVAGEAALMGLIGGLFGLIAGIGLTVIFVVVYGGNSFGLVNLALWSSAWTSVQPALLTGFVGVLLAPLIAGAAAWLPARSISQGTPIKMLTIPG